MRPFVPNGYLSLSDAINRVAAIRKEQRREAGETLRQLLRGGQVPSETLTENGESIQMPEHIWGGRQWNEALNCNRVRFPYGLGGSVSGRPIIPKDALEAAFNTDGTPRSTVEASSVQEASMPRHQYRTRLLDVLERMWSDIDATDWKATPPKKVAIEADLQNRFELSDRDARTIATVFVPDEKRGKAKKG